MRGAGFNEGREKERQKKSYKDNYEWDLTFHLNESPLYSLKYFSAIMTKYVYTPLRVIFNFHRHPSNGDTSTIKERMVKKNVLHYF